ncbi:hypothetical protein [Hymenobacter glacieicola]|uniref:Uncharacterized protein n=1 Tax=Hymenobacter glacieicola TaxID=1562124 RepID=A0ABQ1X598_9BACT|nr:hypothetical protein [Hymenobacter glacieicola]GGG60634.1 hypothetical protein GCM10011378_40820 [Hymenobacter glacieicola]
MTIANKVQLFTYSGPGLNLLTASFLSNVTRITKANQNGQGLISFRPGSSFPPFTSLQDGESYVVYSAAVPYTIPTSDQPKPSALPFVGIGSAFVKTQPLS